MPSEEEKVRLVQMAQDAGMPFMCNTCFMQVQSIKKLKFCQFCAQANCGTCLYKTRPYPKNNPNKTNRGNICV